MLHEELHDAIRQIPVVDIHSHLPPDRMGAADPERVLFYHMLQYPLRATGASEEDLWEKERGIHGTQPAYEHLIRSWPALSSTSFGWALQTILRDLYGFNEPITEESIDRFRQVFAVHTANPGWGSEVLTRAGVSDVLTSHIPDNPESYVGDKAPRIRYTFERTFHSGTREYQSWPQTLKHIERFVGATIDSHARLRQVSADYFGKFDWKDRHALVTWVSSLADFTPRDPSVIDRALAGVLRGEEPDERTNSLLQAAFVRATCESARDHARVVQLIYGTQFLQSGFPHPVQRAAHSFASTLGHLIGEFPELHFNVLNGYEPDEPQLCSLCLAYGNVSLGSFWWHTFYPSVMHAAWHRRLDMVPTTRLMGFFSDGYCVDWIYGRLRMTQRVLSQVLAEKVERGFYRFDQAVGVARAVMCGTPRHVFLGQDACDCHDHPADPRR